MNFSASQIAELLDGEIVGNPDIEVSGLSKIEEGQSGTLSFLANPKYAQHIYDTGASIVIVAKDFLPEKAIPETCTLIKVDEPYASFAKLLEMYNQVKHDRQGIAKSAVIEEDATIGENVFIGANTVVESGVTIGDNAKIYPQVYLGPNVKIGANTIIHPGVRILSDCEIGNDCVIHAGVIIGGDGFGFAPNSENNYKKVAQIGNVIIHDFVEVGANTTIDRATLGSTVIRKGVKIDNLIQIAHNVDIGENTVIAAQTGIAGSTRIGKNCMIGGQVGIVGHISIADGTMIAAQSGIGTSTKEKSILQGSPAFPIIEYKKSYVGFRKLPQLMQEIHQLKEELAAFKSNSET
ncbi:MAG: UDP-3-O-(3-hydroxymyristoyl)glucosamine N-acyltransferase [Rhodanobacteraceae bacterium]